MVKMLGPCTIIKQPSLGCLPRPVQETHGTRTTDWLPPCSTLDLVLDLTKDIKLEVEPNQTQEHYKPNRCSVENVPDACLLRFSSAFVSCFARTIQSGQRSQNSTWISFKQCPIIGKIFRTSSPRHRRRCKPLPG